MGEDGESWGIVEVAERGLGSELGGHDVSVGIGLGSG
jgi:hypothetical protein